MSSSSSRHGLAESVRVEADNLRDELMALLPSGWLRWSSRLAHRIGFTEALVQAMEATPRWSPHSLGRR